MSYKENKNQVVESRLNLLRKEMAKEGIDFYLIPTADYHQSEYVGAYFKQREYVTGFTGSAGTALILPDKAYLWTDGRYFIQAEKQLEGSHIELMKAGEPKVPKISEFIRDHLPEGGVLGLDGRCFGIAEGKQLEKITKEKNGRLVYDKDLVDRIWKDRPALSKEKAFALDIKYAGESTADKLKRIRKKMEQADMLLVTSLDDIGWILNLRGRDVEYFPLLLSYLVIHAANEDGCELYADASKFDEKILCNLEENHVKICPYNDIYGWVESLKDNTCLMLDENLTNYIMYKKIPEAVDILIRENPVILMKSIKNETEVSNNKKAHIKDGIAHTRFMYWLKKSMAAGEKITEISASDKLEEFRAMQADYLGPSFDPISAYGAHGAIVHYSATEETNALLEPRGFLLTDTGGHYLDGSTDITRTVALGPISEAEREDFTTVLISHLHLADAIFIYGATGQSLDYAAREPFWRKGLNFNHGTGHGVGYLGNIHEPPARFQYRAGSGKQYALEEHMVITDEPGLYIEDSHGIRTENELLVVKGEENAYGQFMHFEYLTFVPIDLDAVNVEMMEERDKKLLNAYHRQVREKISPYLNDEEREWLMDYTREI